MSFVGGMAMGLCRAWSHIAPTQRGGYRLARLARSLAPRREWTGLFRAQGVALNLDLATYPDCCMASGLYELDTLRLIRKALKPGAHFVDLGANIGYFTLRAARLVGPGGRVDAFEPDPVNRARLEEHLALNQSPPQVKVHALAAADRDGQATLYHPGAGNHNHGEASLFAIAGAELTPYTVRTVRLDEAVDRPPDLIKMDIEGAELMAIRGMAGLLSGDRAPALIIEHNPESSRSAGHRPGDLLRELQRMRPQYQAWWIGLKSRPMSAEQIDAQARQGNIHYRVKEQKKPAEG